MAACIRGQTVWRGVACVVGAGHNDPQRAGHPSAVHAQGLWCHEQKGQLVAHPRVAGESGASQLIQRLHSWRGDGCLWAARARTSLLVAGCTSPLHCTACGLRHTACAWRGVQVLIIDEVSMLSGEMLECMECELRTVRGREGGVCCVLVCI